MRPGYDWFFPYYRDGALMLGLGVTAKDLLLQAVGSADDPASGGRQMPCHWSFPDKNVVTQSSATGSQCIPAVGCAEAGRYIVRRPDLPDASTAYGDELTYVSLGEGACSQGEFWESLNTACTLHLPVLFVVADNGYAISVPADDQHPAPVSDLVRGFRGLAIHKMDGRDYFEVRSKGSKAIERVRAGEGPGLIHAIVTRPYSHSLSDDQRKYRTAAKSSPTSRSTTRSTSSSASSCAPGSSPRTKPPRSGRKRRTTCPQAATEALAAAASRSGDRARQRHRSAAGRHRDDRPRAGRRRRHVRRGDPPDACTK